MPSVISTWVKRQNSPTKFSPYVPPNAFPDLPLDVTYDILNFASKKSAKTRHLLSSV